MKINQFKLEDGVWNFASEMDQSADLVMCFGERSLLTDGAYANVRRQFPNATIIAGSTAGEINNECITDNTVVATAVNFEEAKVSSSLVNIQDFENSYQAGTKLMHGLSKKGLKYVFVLSDGQLVNGSDLVAGINDALDHKITVSGGLAGDGSNFKETIIGLDENLNQGNIAAIGFYGEKLKIGYGSKGGWDQFGLTREVTRAEQNVLYEIDGESALDLYMKYLGDYAQGLPGSALLFPLAIQMEDGTEIVRTVLSVDHEEKSMTFAGNIPTGSQVRLMKANLDNLVDAASDAVAYSNQASISENEDKLSILISCVGRKIIFGDRIEEEHEVAREVLGSRAVMTGFYSYGEICPFASFEKCSLHNQTMTVTTLTEA